MAGREIDFLATMRQENMPRGANLPNRFPPSTFLYQQERNHCVCPEGKILRPQARRQAGPGMIYHLYEARFEGSSMVRKLSSLPLSGRGRSSALSCGRILSWSSGVDSSQPMRLSAAASGLLQVSARFCWDENR